MSKPILDYEGEVYTLKNLAEGGPAVLFQNGRLSGQHIEEELTRRLPGAFTRLHILVELVEEGE